MDGRSPAEAVNNYLHAIQMLVSCVTNSVVDVSGGYFPSPTPHRLTINNGLPVALAGPSRFMLELRQGYRIVRTGLTRDSWEVEITGYSYVVHDSEQAEVILYHWHPAGHSYVTTPHIHLAQGAQVGRRELQGAHLPTGHVSLSAFLRLLILDLEVQHRDAASSTPFAHGILAAST